MISFDPLRRKDHSIDLRKLYFAVYGRSNTKAETYLDEIERVFPITSRQAAATAVVTAERLSK